MTELAGVEPGAEWARRWRVARATLVAAAGWIVTLPILAQLMHWGERTVTQVQNVLGPISGLVWGRIGWVGVRRYGFSTEDAFLAGGLAGAVAPTFSLTLRRLGWPPGPRSEGDLAPRPPSLSIYLLAWLWGFLFGGFLAALGAVLARIGRD